MVFPELTEKASALPLVEVTLKAIGGVAVDCGVITLATVEMPSEFVSERPLKTARLKFVSSTP